MKKNKKLLKGMTLVEVVVAMIIFFLMFSTIISVFAVSLKQINLSRRRDLRTAEEAMVVGKKVKADAAGVNKDLDPVGENEYTVTFDDGRGKTSNNISLYQAKSASAFKSDFGFQLKTFGKSDSFFGMNTENNASDEYRFKITNDRADTVTMYVTINGSNDYIYEGSTGNGYIHSSKVYVRTIAPRQSIDFGYKNNAADAFNNISIQYIASGVTYNISNPIKNGTTGYDNTTRVYTGSVPNATT